MQIGSRRPGVLVITLCLVTALAAPGWTAPAAADGNEAPAAPAAFRTLSAGYGSVCTAVSARLYCWGENTDGGLGLGDTTARGDDPGEVGFLQPSTSLGTGRTATAVSAGLGQTCAVLDNGQLKCWGRNDHGQLGLGDTSSRGDGPNEMGDNLPAVSLGTGRTATAISAGGLHTCTLLDNGQVKCWGNNQYGQLGLGDATSRGDGPNEMGDNLPAVSLGTGRTATAISAGTYFTCARLDNGQVKCWGRSDQGQVGLGDTASRGDGPNEMGDNLPAVSLGTGRTATAISAGHEFTCALLDTSQIKCWGANLQGQLGLGDTLRRGDNGGEMGDNLLAVSLGTGRTAVGVSAGDASVCALLDTAQIKCWGANGNGELGLRDLEARGDNANEMGNNLPTVDLGTGRSVTAVSAGFSFACARLDNGQVKCWGSGGRLGLGDGVARGGRPEDMGDSLLAVPLPPIGRVTGQVRDAATNLGIQDVTVIVLRSADFGLVQATFTDASGGYSLELRPGTYFLYLVDGSGKYRDGFAGSPTMVTITDAVSTSLNATLSGSRGGFSGTVTDQRTGQPLSDVGVFAIGAGGIMGQGYTDATGHYVVSGLPPSSYRAVFIDLSGGRAAEYYPNSVDFAGSSPFNVVAGATTSNINGSLLHP